MNTCGNRSPRTGFVCAKIAGHAPPHQAEWSWGNNAGPTWTYPTEGNPPHQSVTGPRYHLDNVWLRGTALWVRISNAIKAGVNEFRTPSKVDPDQLGTARVGTTARGTTLEIPHSTPSTPPSPQPHCTALHECAYSLECWLTQRCLADAPDWQPWIKPRW